MTPTAFDRVFAVVEDLLFSLTRQSHRFGCGTDPRQQLTLYDTAFLTPFTEAGEQG